MALHIDTSNVTLMSEFKNAIEDYVQEYVNVTLGGTHKEKADRNLKAVRLRKPMICTCIFLVVYQRQVIIGELLILRGTMLNIRQMVFKSSFGLTAQIFNTV